MPEGLVGPPSTTCIKVEGINCTAILDGGSQVTIIFDSWYEKRLSHISLHPCSSLAVWGLSESGSSYPYRGYIQVESEVTAKTPGNARPIPVLALVCPDSYWSDNIPVLVGTNVRQIRPFTSIQDVAEPDNIRSISV